MHRPLFQPLAQKPSAISKLSAVEKAFLAFASSRAHAGQRADDARRCCLQLAVFGSNDLHA